MIYAYDLQPKIVVTLEIYQMAGEMATRRCTRIEWRFIATRDSNWTEGPRDAARPTECGRKNFQNAHVSIVVWAFSVSQAVTWTS